jgi:hypothetical protein
VEERSERIIVGAVFCVRFLICGRERKVESLGSQCKP